MAATKSVQDILNQIYAGNQHAAVNLPANFKPVPVADNGAGGGGGHGFGMPGFAKPTFHKILDVLGRTAHASAELASADIKHTKEAVLHHSVKDLGEALANNFLMVGSVHEKGVRDALRGKSTKRYSDVIKKDLNYSGPGAGTLGFAGDVLLDPLTYVGGAGVASKIGKAAELGADATKVERTVQAAKNVGKFYSEQLGVAPAARGVKTVGETAARVAKGGPLRVAKVPSVLPKGLGSAKPTFNFGQRRYNLKFADDVSKALYIVGGTGKSARHNDYLDFLKAHYGTDEKTILAHSADLRATIKRQAAAGKGGDLEVDTHPSVFDDAPPVAEPKVTKPQVTKIPTKSGPVDYARNPGILAAQASLEKVLAENSRIKPVGEIKAPKPKAPKASVVEKPAVLKTPENLTKDDKTAIMARVHELMNNRFHKMEGLGAEKAKLKAAGIRPSDGTLTKWADIPPKIQEQLLRQSPKLVAEWKKTIATATQEHLAKVNKVVKAAPKAKQIEEAAVATPLPAVSPAAERASALGAKLKDDELAISDEAIGIARNNVKNNPNNGGHLSAADQVNLRSLISARVLRAMSEAKGRNAIKPTGKAVQARINKIYAHAEAVLERDGAVPAVIGKTHMGVNGAEKAQDLTKLRLSTLLPHLGPEDVVDGQYLTQVLEGNAVDPRIRALRAAAYQTAHIEDATKIEPVLHQLSDAYRAVAESNDVGEISQFVEHSAEAAKDAAKATGASPTAVKAVEDVAKADHTQLVDLDPLTAASVDNHHVIFKAVTTGDGIDRARYLLNDATGKSIGLRVGTNPAEGYAKLLKTGKVAAKFQTKLGLARNDVGLLTPIEDATLGKFAAAVATVDRWMNVGFNNAMGYADLKPFKTGMTNAGISHIADAQLQISKMFKGVSRADTVRAYKQAQAGVFDETPIGDLARQIEKRMEDIYGEHGLLTRAAITPDEHQSFLNRAFFPDKTGYKPKFKYATEHKGTIGGLDHTIDNPYQSWRHWPMPKGKYESAPRVMLAMEDAAHKAVVMRKAEDSLGYYFGAKNAVEGMEQIGRYHFPKEIAPQVRNLMDSFTHTGKYSNEFLRGYDKFLHTIKTGFTKYLPSHHINNSIGQFLMAFTDGVTSPKWYMKSIRVLKGHEAEIDPYKLIADAPGDGTPIMHWKGQPLSKEQVYQLGVQFGIRQVHATADDLETEVKMMGRISSAVQRGSNARENFHRYGHFMFALSQSKAPDLEMAAREAAARVNAIHGDYNDLTRFERSVMKRVIPFYTWQRKVGPIVFKQMMTNPGRTMVPAKLAADYSISQGGDPDEPFPNMNGLVPSYMTDLLQVPLGHAGNGNERWGGPRTPFSDVVGQYSNHPIKQILSSLSPAIKLPVELGTMRDDNSGTSLGGIPFFDGRVAHTEDSLPYIGLVKRLTRIDPANSVLHGGIEHTKDADKNPDQQGLNTTAILNLLLGTSMQENTQAAQRYAKKEVAKKEKANAAK